MTNPKSSSQAGSYITRIRRDLGFEGDGPARMPECGTTKLAEANGGVHSNLLAVPLYGAYRTAPLLHCTRTGFSLKDVFELASAYTNSIEEEHSS